MLAMEGEGEEKTGERQQTVRMNKFGLEGGNLSYGPPRGRSKRETVMCGFFCSVMQVSASSSGIISFFQVMLGSAWRCECFRSGLRRTFMSLVLFPNFSVVQLPRFVPHRFFVSMTFLVVHSQRDSKSRH